jgi:hypothetical protein
VLASIRATHEKASLKGMEVTKDAPVETVYEDCPKKLLMLRSQTRNVCLR